MSKTIIIFVVFASLAGNCFTRSNDYLKPAAKARYEAVAAIVFDTIKAYLEQVNLKPDEASDLTQISNTYRDAALAQLKTGNTLVLNSLQSARTQNAAGADTSTAGVATTADERITGYFNAIAIATNRNLSYSEASKAIEAIRNKTISEIPDRVNKFYDIIRNKEELDEQTTARIKAIQEAATSATLDFSTKIYNGIALLLAATQINIASKEGYSALKTYRAATVAIPDILVDHMFEARDVVGNATLYRTKKNNRNSRIR